jgi:hypothetical protein
MRDQKSPKGFKGFCIDMIDEIAKIVNFDYDIQEVEDGKFGDIVFNPLNTQNLSFNEIFTFP